MKTFFLLLAAVAAVNAQRPPSEPPPLIYRSRILNAASFRPSGLPGGGIARGSMFSIFGARLGPASDNADAPRLPLAQTLAGVAWCSPAPASR